MLKGNRAATRARRSAFTLVEIAVTAAIVVIIGALAWVTLISSREAARASASYEILRGLAASISRFDTLTGGGAGMSFAGKYPLQLYHLTNQITSTASANCTLCRNSCGATAPANSVYSLTNQTGWTTFGPFYGRDVRLYAGFPIPIGLVRDSLVRTPSTAVNADTSLARLQIRIDSVSVENLEDLEYMVDGTNNSTTGTIQWSASPVDGVYPSIFWTMPIRGC